MNRKFYFSALVIVGLLVVAGAVYAISTTCGGNPADASGHLKDCYKATTSQTTRVGDPAAPIAEWGQCRDVTNNAGLDLFVPTNTSSEWQTLWTTDVNLRPIALPTGISLQQCGGGGNGCQTVSQNFNGNSGPNGSRNAAINSAQTNVTGSTASGDWKQAATVLLNDMKDSARHRYNNRQSYWTNNGNKSGQARVMTSYVFNWQTTSNNSTRTYSLSVSYSYQYDPTNQANPSCPSCPPGQYLNNGACLEEPEDPDYDSCVSYRVPGGGGCVQICGAHGCHTYCNGGGGGTGGLPACP